MTQTNATVHRHEDLFYVRRGRRVTVVMHSEDGEWTGELIDISPNGFRVSMQESPRSLQSRKPISAVFSIAHFGEFYRAKGLYFANATDESNYVVSFRMAEPVDLLIFHQLLEEEILTRREHERHVIYLPALAQLEMVAEPVEISLMDVSVGGICFLSPIDPVLGHRVRCSVQGGGSHIDLNAVICWSSRNNKGYTVGCRLCSENLGSVQNLIAIYDALASEDADRPDRRHPFLQVIG
ncbi:MAG: PilZ domain-containing protein [Planctomycetales bacterium]|nr:PilZ domain-containing protein [Planctomycetales bacterium]